MHDERPPRRRALLLENIHPGAATLLQQAGFEVETEPGAFTEFRIVLPRLSIVSGKAGGTG